MKKDDFAQIKGLDQKAILEKTREIRLEINDLVLDKNMNKLKDVKLIYKKRKDLARMLTVLNQKKIIEQLESKVVKKEKNEGGVKP